MPFVAVGFALLIAAMSASKFSTSASTGNEARPIVHCTMPALSARYWTWPPLAFFTASSTFGVTVPTFGFGMRPRGPSTWPSGPTTFIASGVAITTSKSMKPPFTRSARSSKPTMSAPAAFAFSAFAPWVNTATRTVLPVPRGSTTLPRTTWSDFFASMPRFTATSTDSSNFAVAVFFTSSSAAFTSYAFERSTSPVIFFTRFETSAMSDALHFHAHAAGGAGDRAHGRVEVRGGEIGLLRLRDLLGLLAGELAHLVGVRLGAAFLEFQRLGDQHRRRRRLGDEGEALVRVRGDDDREHQPRLHLLRLRVERLAEFHDVQPALAERRTDGRRRIRLARRHLQLDETDDLLRHVSFSCGCKRMPARAPSPVWLSLLDLPEIELDRRRTPEDQHGDANLALLVVHFLHRPVEVGEGAFRHAHRFAHLEEHLGLRLLHAFLHLVEDVLDFLVRDGRGAHRRAADEAGHLRRALHEVPRLVRHVHLHEDVAGEEAPLADRLLPALHLDHLFRRHQHLAELVLHPRALDAVEECRLDALLLARIGVHDVPTHGHLVQLPVPSSFWVIV